MLIGRFQMGDRLPIAVQVRAPSNVPALPAVPPLVQIAGDEGIVQTLKLPLARQDGLDAYFYDDLLLDGRYQPGRYSLLATWRVTGEFPEPIGVTTFTQAQHDEFDVLPGGDPRGPGISMYYVDRPVRPWLLMQTAGGTLERKGNPRL